MSLVLTPKVIVNIEDQDEVLLNALTELNEDVDSIKSDTAKLPNDPASITSINAVNSNLNGVHNDVNVIRSKTDNLPANTATELLGISEKTDNLPANTATEISGIRSKTDNLPTNTSTTLTSILNLIGTTLDDEDNVTLFGKLYILLKHAHPDLTDLWPSGQDSLQITKPSGGWAGGWGSKVEFIATNAITKYFDGHFIHITAITANGEYEIGIWEGLNGAEVLKHIIPVSRTSNQAQEGRFQIITKYFEPNTRITLSLRGNTVGSESLKAKLITHSY